METLFEMMAKKDQLIEEKQQVIGNLYREREQIICSIYKEKEQVICSIYKELRQLEQKIHEEQLKNADLKSQLAIRNTEYLRVTKSLHIRSVCEEFEASNPVLGNTIDMDSREKKWKKMLQSHDVKSSEFQKCLKECELDLDKVPKLAKEFFNKINSAVHGDFRTSNDNLRIVKRWFTADEFVLANCIVKCYGIASVDIID